MDGDRDGDRIGNRMDASELRHRLNRLGRQLGQPHAKLAPRLGLSLSGLRKQI